MNNECVTSDFVKRVNFRLANGTHWHVSWHLIQKVRINPLTVYRGSSTMLDSTHDIVFAFSSSNITSVLQSWKIDQYLLVFISFIWQIYIYN